MSVHVFLGPSLTADEARTLLPRGVIHPPVAMGQVYQVAQRKVSAIAIIDGLFEQVPAVWHKEILYALDRGIPVFGASSMGALRAAELEPFGMHGVGRIFEAFRDGALEDDDEVAVAHGPVASGYRNLSTPMVNIREGLRRAEAAGVVRAETHRALLTAVKRLFYPDRSWERVAAIAIELDIPADEREGLRLFLKQEPIDVKADDARALLRHLAELDAGGIPPHRPGFVLERTKFWDQMIEGTAPFGTDEAQAHGGGAAVTAQALWDQVRVTADDLEELERGVLLLHLAANEARRQGWWPQPEAVQAEADGRRQRFGLLTTAATDGWLQARGITRRDLARHVQADLILRHLLTLHSTKLVPLLRDELHRRDRLRPTIEAIAEKQRVLREHGVVNPSLADAGVDAATLIQWYEKHRRPLEGTTLDEHAKWLGFDSTRAFLTEVLAQYIVEHDAQAGSMR